MAETKSEKTSAINVVFVAFIAGAILFAAFTGRMQQITDASFQAAKSAVTLAIGLIGVMALWLGFIRVLEAGGLMYSIARWVKPVMVRLFPDVPSEHPAMSAMMLNISANMLGLGNAATPLGIKAMVELNKLNPFPGMATNAMCLFLAINTSSVTLLPLGVIGVRAAAGSVRPAEIFLPSLIATLCSTIVGVFVAVVLAKRDTQYVISSEKARRTLKSPKGGSEHEADDSKSASEDLSHLVMPASALHKWIAFGMLSVFGAAFFYQVWSASDRIAFFSGDLVTYWLMPVLMLLILSYGVCRGVKIYEAVTDGAKQGFDIAIRIIPFLVAILVAVGMFRASGAMEVLVSMLEPVTSLIGMPADTLPMALVRPLSGSGAFGVMSALVEIDPDSYSSYVASTMQGSTETTFYVLAVYFGAAGVTRIRHALVAALIADITGIIVSCLVCSAMWGGS